MKKNILLIIEEGNIGHIVHSKITNQGEGLIERPTKTTIATINIKKRTTMDKIMCPDGEDNNIASNTSNNNSIMSKTRMTLSSREGGGVRGEDRDAILEDSQDIVTEGIISKREKTMRRRNTTKRKIKKCK